MVHFIWACKKIKEQFVKNTLSIYASNVVFFIMLSFFPFAMFLSSFPADAAAARTGLFSP